MAIESMAVRGGVGLSTVDQLQALLAERKLDEASVLYRKLTAAGHDEPEVHYLGAQAARALGNLFAARHFIELAADRQPAAELLGKIRFTRALVYREIGETLSAIEELTAWIADASEYSTLKPLLKGAVLYNRGLAFRQARRYEQSIADYVQACVEFRQEGMLQYLCMALHNLAWVCCLSGKVEMAWEALQEAEPLCTTDHLKWHQRLGQAFAESLGDNKQPVLDSCESIVSEPAEIPLCIRSHACWLAGRIGVELGLFEAAEQMALSAIHYGALAKDENRCLSDGGDLLRLVRSLHHMAQPRGSA